MIDNKKQILDDFFRLLEIQKNRYLLLDYDGTLAPFNEQRQLALPYPGVSKRIQQLLDLSLTEIVIISGRKVEETRNLLKLRSCPEIWGVHGFEHMNKDGTHSYLPIDLSTENALNKGRSALQELLANGIISASNVEDKKASIAVHWRSLDPTTQKKLYHLLYDQWSTLDGNALKISPFDGGIELRVAGRNKGTVIKEILNRSPTDSAVAYLGDDLTDEDAFAALGEKGLKILVRKENRPTKADIQLIPPEELLDFFDRWIDSDRKLKVVTNE